MADRKDFFRQIAVNYRQLAEIARNPEIKQRMLEMAAHYEAKADEHTERCATGLTVSRRCAGGGLFPWLNELATRLHFAKYAVRGKAVDVAKLAYRRRIDSRSTN